MWPDRVSNPGHLALESDALPTALRGPASVGKALTQFQWDFHCTLKSLWHFKNRL